MKKKLLMAMVLALIFTLSLVSLAQADQVAQVVFTTDVCASTVVVISYTNPQGQPTTASGLTPWTLDTLPSTPVTFFYPATVTCDGVTHNFQSVSPGNPVISGAAGETTTVTGHYLLPTDTTPPVWTIPSDFSVEATDPAGAAVNYTAFASDPSGVSSQSCSPASGSAFAMGTTTVTCTATDTHNNTSSGGFNVTVVDTTPPALTLPANMTVTALNASGAAVSFTASATDLVDGPVAVTCSPESGSLFPIGITTVNCSATDSHGNAASGGFNVTVQYATKEFICDSGTSGQVLPPLSPNGPKEFRRGSTIPIRFRVCGADGQSIGTPDLITSFQLIQVIGTGTVEQFAPSTTTDVFRFINHQWIFNMRTRKLAAGNTYVYLITLNDGSTIQFQFTLR